MDPERHEIIPFTITEVKTVKYFRVYVSRVELFKSALFGVDCLDENYDFVTAKELRLEGQDYLNWKDDQYVINKVYELLNTSPPN